MIEFFERILDAMTGSRPPTLRQTPVAFSFSDRRRGASDK
jgi:hypothetical protein